MPENPQKLTEKRVAEITKRVESNAYEETDVMWELTEHIAALEADVKVLRDALAKTGRSLGYYLDFHEHKDADYDGDGAMRLFHKALTQTGGSDGGEG